MTQEKPTSDKSLQPVTDFAGQAFINDLKRNAGDVLKAKAEEEARAVYKKPVS